MTKARQSGPDASRPGCRPPVPAPEQSGTSTIPTSVVVGAAIRAMRRSAGPAVVSPIARSLSTKAAEGDPTAPVVLDWMTRRSRADLCMKGSAHD